MKLKHTFNLIQLDDQTIAVPVGESADKYHGAFKMNETAAFIFHLLKDDISEEAIVEALKAEYNAPETLLASDVHRYLEEFKKRDMLFL